uniref:Uncharacterized protein n=1 Tax=Siphoviridae sp. ctRlz6 TaxID=2823581 RepID=A0A8S5LDS8_9CAUD|nr:MAG TPA: hypothetical protein [Siphoviridae sp. ctRlz6]
MPMACVNSAVSSAVPAVTWVSSKTLTALPPRSLFRWPWPWRRNGLWHSQSQSVSAPPSALVSCAPAKN